MRFENPDRVAKWPAPNFVNPETRGPTLFIVNGIFLALASIAVLLRLYARLFVRRWFGLDDAMALIAWLCTIGDQAAVYIGAIHFMWDRHMWDGDPKFLRPGTKTVFAAKIMWATSSCLIRLSLIVYFYRLLDHAQLRRYRWVLHFMTFWVVGIWFSYEGTTIWACVPIGEYFNWPPNGTCIREGYADTILSAFNTLSELVVALLPIPVVFRLKMNPIQRWSVISLLSLGVFVSIVGSIRTYYLWMLFSTDDLTWYAYPHWICSEVEICTALICASVPSLRPLLGRLFSRERILVEQPKDSHDSRTMTEGRQSNTYDQKTSFDDRSFSPFGYRCSTPIYRTVDLEGIDINDGLGYTVTITAGPARPKRKSKLRKLSLDMEAGSPTSRTAWDTDSTLRAPQRALSRLSGHYPLETVHEKAAMEIVERRSLEIRESWHAGMSRPKKENETSPSIRPTAVPSRFMDWSIRTGATMSSFGSFLFDEDSDADEN